MPSFRIGEPTVSFSIFDVVGQDGGQPCFISHAGLAQSEGSQSVDAVRIIDMGPPLHGPSQAKAIRASAVGRAELTDDETQKIRTFVDQHASEHESFQHLIPRQLMQLAPQMYCIYPHANPLYEDDGRYARMRFSCSGFVFEAYNFARIRLLEPGSLPTVDTAVIEMAYPDYARLMALAFITPESLGLNGSGPWPVLLCGYLVHALGRPAGNIRHSPYTPVPGDQYYPHDDGVLN